MEIDENGKSIGALEIEAKIKEILKAHGVTCRQAKGILQFLIDRVDEETIYQ